MKWLWIKFSDPIKDLLQRKGRFSRGLLAILSGTVLSRLIALAVVPLLSRIYTPSDFGVLAIFVMITATFSTLVTWRYEAAIVLPEKDEDAANLLGVCIGLCTVISGLIGILFFYYAETISVFFGAPELTPWLGWSPICIWAIGVFTALRMWNSRTDDFKSISIALVGDVTTLAITQIGLGLVFRGMLTGLMLGPYFARIMGVLILLFRTLKSDGSLILSSLNFSRAYKQAVRYVRFPLYDLPASMLSNISREMPTGVLGIFFVTQWVGLYSIANRILSLPMQVMGGAIAQVYLPVAHEAKKQGRLDTFTLSIFDRLLGISFTPMLAVAISAPALINVVLGEQWFMAGEILRYLMPSVFMAFIASPLSEIYSVLERQKEKLVFNIAVFITRLFSLVVGGLLGDPLLAIIMYSLSGTIFWLLQCYWILRMSDIKNRKIIKHVMAEVLRALPFIVLNIMAQLYYSGSPRRITLVLCISMLVFLALRWKEFLGPGTLENAHAS